ncbi:NHLP family bacteriocin export ABC transporter peptidase/permease/ATPase subunit [Streptomyces sp. 6N106]|uniref:NHLP family bacteriocin export ABC transporter peptidase/permease/ATPase subunit n=1 Tax=Streptomyces sp. 6N106 TaxID=3457418 RepID=UPI003FD0921F
MRHKAQRADSAPPAERSRAGREAQGGSRSRRKRVRTTTVLQMETAECGAAALSMVLAHYKLFLPLEELRLACGISRDGSKASNIAKAARLYGMTSKGVRTEVERLSSITLPAILFWEFNHFVVLEGLGKRFGSPVFYLNDPAIGRRVITAEELDGSFTGIALIFEPGDNFRPGGRRPGILSGLPARLRGSARFLTLAMTTSLLLAVVGIVVPGVVRTFVDEVLLSGDRSFLIPYATLFALAITATGALTAVQQSLLLKARIVGATVTTMRFFEHLVRLPLTFIAHRSHADLASRVRSNDDVALTLSRDLTLVMVNTLVAVGYGCFLWTYDGWLTAVSVGIALLNVGILLLSVRFRANGVTKVAADSARLLTTSYNGLQLIETLKAMGGEVEFFRRWSSEHAKLVSARQQVGLPAAMLSVGAPMLATLNSTLVLLIGGLQAVRGAMSIGTLVAFQALVTAFSAPITHLLSVAGRVQDFGVQLARLDDVEKHMPEHAPAAPETRLTGRLRGQLIVDQVTFGYNRMDQPLLRDVSIAVDPGHRVALIGGSGSGKTTVSKVIAGLVQAWSGSVSFDGIPSERIPRSVLAKSISFVDQDIFLFHGTVRDNVTLWDTSISDDDVIAALRDAAVYDEVAARSGGIYTRVEENGRNFSGGQRQRLEIARALVNNPSLLVLDEATSALDSTTELLVLDNLRRRGCAMVVIAHRLSTVRHSDEIVVLRHGHVEERGTHDELVRRHGAYFQLVRGR